MANDICHGNAQKKSGYKNDQWFHAENRILLTNEPAVAVSVTGGRDDDSSIGANIIVKNLQPNSRKVFVFIWIAAFIGASINYYQLHPGFYRCPNSKNNQ
jgi:hypothetical protein